MRILASAIALAVGARLAEHRRGPEHEIDGAWQGNHPAEAGDAKEDHAREDCGGAARSAKAVRRLPLVGMRRLGSGSECSCHDGAGDGRSRTEPSNQGNVSAPRSHHDVIKFVALFRHDRGVFAARGAMIYFRVHFDCRAFLYSGFISRSATASNIMRACSRTRIKIRVTRSSILPTNGIAHEKLSSGNRLLTQIHRVAVLLRSWERKEGRPTNDEWRHES